MTSHVRRPQMCGYRRNGDCEAPKSDRSATVGVGFMLEELILPVELTPMSNGAFIPRVDIGFRSTINRNAARGIEGKFGPSAYEFSE